MLKDFNKIIFGKYQMLKILGRGSFGSVFKGINKITKENVAIKIEDWKKVGNILESEAYFLFYLKSFGIPEIKAFGTYKNYKVLVQTLLGDNFEHIFANKITNFNYKDICMVAIQLIDRLEYIHSKYVIHRDLKPENIMIDLETKKIVYLIDFGMAKKYRSSKTKKHIKYSIPNRLTGTARYCSINALRGTEQSRRDDLESAGYVLIYLAQRGYLPWMGLNIPEKLERYRKIYQIKKAIKEEELCQYLPDEFGQYIKYTKKLSFEEEPDYNYLRGLFKELLIKYKSQNDLKFSWNFKNRKTKKEEENLISQRNNNFKKKENPKQRLLRNIQNSHERENSIDNLNQEKLINIIEEKQEKRDKNIIEKNKKRESLELSLKKNSDNIQDSPSFAPIKKDEYSEDGTKIALFNIAIDIEDLDEIKNSNENKNDNANNVNINLNNSDKVEIRNKNENNSLKKENVIKIDKNSIDDKKSEEKQEKNTFSFVNDSFKGIEESEQKNKSENNNNIINNNINNINDNIIVVENNEINNKNDINNLNNIHKKINANSPKKKNIIKKSKENNNIKAPINNIINLNQGKIIKITPNLNHKYNNSKNIKSAKILNPNQINFDKNKIHNMNIKEMFERKNNNLKLIKLNKNNINNYFLDTTPMNINLSSENFYHNDSLKANKSGKSINSINKKTNYNRNVINYNKINIHNSNSAGKLVLNKKLTIKTYDYQKLLNSNSAKQINSILSRNNYQKMNLPYAVSPINTIENLNINSSLGLFKPNTIRLIKNKSQKNNDRILTNQKLNQLISSKNKSKNNILKLNLFPFNNGDFKSQFNNNIIKNLNYSINYVKTELNDNNKNQFNNNRKNNNDLIITQYNDKRNKKFQYPKLKMINVNKNQKNNNYLNNNINLSFNNNKKLILPNNNYANNLNYNKIDNTNYYNKISYN